LPGGGGPAIVGQTNEEDAPMPDASTTTTRDTATPELMKAISAAFNSRDVDRIVSFFTDDATFWLARGPEPVPDMRWDHKEYIFAGNRAISVWMVKGKGADGEDLNYEGCDIYTFRGGKICAKNTFWKMVEHKARL
jgi:ketosteroid isomerase-like protein